MLSERDNDQISESKLNMGEMKDGAGSKPAPSVAQLRRAMHRQIFLIMLCVVVSGLSAGAYISRAWFANNKEVAGTNSAITSDTPTPSLYIRPSSEKDKDKAYADTVKRELGASLYPMSTNDLEHWFYASSFTFGTYTVTSAATDGSDETTTETTSVDIPGAPIANDFAEPESITLDLKGTSGQYENKLEGDTRTAYYYASDNLYTSTGSLDVYLNPTDPITVTLNTSDAASDGTGGTGSSAAGKEEFRKSLRVGLKCGDTVLIYAPEEETGGGNTTGDDGSSNYKAIAAVTDSGAATKWKLVSGSTECSTTHDLSGYQAARGTGEDYTGGTTKLCTATMDGTDVDIYVWLEGTDSAAMLGKSDSDSVGVTVNVSYVGVVPES